VGVTNPRAADRPAGGWPPEGGVIIQRSNYYPFSVCLIMAYTNSVVNVKRHLISSRSAYDVDWGFRVIIRIRRVGSVMNFSVVNGPKSFINVFMSHQMEVDAELPEKLFYG
jgi:hypothetical protein